MSNTNGTVAPEAAQNQNGAKGVAVIEKNVADSVLNRINQLQEIGEIQLPANYSAPNAIKAAWLTILEVVDRNKKPALQVCTKESIANAIYEMVVRGLSVVRKQCYFVVYGNKLELEESYIGKIAIAKRDSGVKDVNAVTVYADDVFEYEINTTTGRKKVVKHDQKLANIDITKIVGAYAIITYEDDSTDTEIMTMSQIRKAWEQGAAKGDSPAHKNFTDQMAEKTVIARALKIAIGSADDSQLPPRKETPVSAGVKHEIRQNANKKEMKFEEAELVDDPATASDEEEITDGLEDTTNNEENPI